MWVLGNVFFGLIPLVFISFIYALSAGKAGYKEIQHLIHDGIVLFVCTSITGSVLVDLMLSGITMKVSLFFGFLVIPVIVFAFALAGYSLISLKIIESSDLEKKPSGYIIVMVLAITSCIFVKTFLYIKEKS